MLYTINTDVISYYSPVYILCYTQLILMLLVTPVYKLYYTQLILMLVTIVLCIYYIIHNEY